MFVAVLSFFKKTKTKGTWLSQRVIFLDQSVFEDTQVTSTENTTMCLKSRLSKDETCEGLTLRIYKFMKNTGLYF